MSFPIDAIFDEAENRYLKPDEINLIGQYVSSLPERITAYRALRDQEREIVQQVADQLQADLPNAAIEQTLKNGILSLRYCAMGMLLDDEAFVQQRLLIWLNDSIQLHNTSAIDAAFFSRLKQHLIALLGAKQWSLLESFLSLVETAIPTEEAEVLTLTGMF